MPSSHHRHGQDKTVLSCRESAQNWQQVKTVFSSRHRILRLDKKVSKLSVAEGVDLSPILFTPPTQTRQDSHVLVGGVNYALQIVSTASRKQRTAEYMMYNFPLLCFHTNSPRSTQSCIPLGSLNRVPALAEGKAGKSLLPGGM